MQRYDCVLERKVQKDVNDACGWLGYFRRDFEGNRWVGHESKLKGLQMTGSKLRLFEIIDL